MPTAWSENGRSKGNHDRDVDDSIGKVVLPIIIMEALERELGGNTNIEIYPDEF